MAAFLQDLGDLVHFQVFHSALRNPSLLLLINTRQSNLLRSCRRCRFSAVKIWRQDHPGCSIRVYPCTFMRFVSSSSPPASSEVKNIVNMIYCHWSCRRGFRFCYFLRLFSCTRRHNRHSIIYSRGVTGRDNGNKCLPFSQRSHRKQLLISGCLHPLAEMTIDMFFFFLLTDSNYIFKAYRGVQVISVWKSWKIDRFSITHFWSNGGERSQRKNFCKIYIQLR